jgi:tetratricopeptide (TPR) repeat protein
MSLDIVTKDSAAISLWNAADILAAQHRLRLARHYQHQFERLDLEFTNLSQARTKLSNQKHRETAHLLIEYLQVMTPYLRKRGLDRELLQWCEDSLLACRLLQQNPGWILLHRGGAQNRLGQWEDAKESFIAATEASENYDTHLYAKATLELGRLLLNQGYYKRALTLLAEAEGLLDAPSQYESRVIAKSEVAAYHLNRGELDKALALYKEADQLRRQAGANQSSDHTLMMLGVVYRKKGNHDLAIDYLQKLLARGETQGNQGAVAPAAHHLAWTYLNMGELAEARYYCGQAMALYEEMDDPRGVSDGYEQLGLILLTEGHYEDAVAHLGTSLRMREQLGNQQGAASSLRRLALARWQMGERLSAAREMRASLKIYWQIGVLSRQRLFKIWREFFKWWTERRR